MTPAWDLNNKFSVTEDSPVAWWSLPTGNCAVLRRGPGMVNIGKTLAMELDFYGSDRVS